MTNEKLLVSPSPHINSKESIAKIMWLVSLSLLPAAVGGVYFFGLKTIPVFISAIAGSLSTEAVIQLLRKKPVGISDGSAFLTGFLLALNMPPDIPLWLPFLGSVFAIAIVKQSFGGIGFNIFNPALGGRVFLILAYTQHMTTGWTPPRGGELSAVTGATPLTAWFEGTAGTAQILFSPSSIYSLFTGRVGGCIGETSALLLLAGAVFLFLKKYISWHIPITFLGALGIFSWIFRGPGCDEFFSGDVLFHLFSGGAFIGAFFMATDMVTSPITPKGKIIFGFGCGLLTALIRYYAGYPEGVSFAILLMNSAVPLIDRHTKPRVYGTYKRIKNARNS
jgi:Na+-translocating ferredoxin:NAD+ oxidoreductase subunit D